MGRRKQPIGARLDTEGLPSLAEAQLDNDPATPSRQYPSWAKIFDISPPQISRELRMQVFADTLARQLIPVTFQRRNATFLFPKSYPHERNSIARVLGETRLFPQTILDIASNIHSDMTLATMLLDASFVEPKSLEGRLTRQLNAIGFGIQSYLGIEPDGSRGSEFAQTLRALHRAIPDSFRSLSRPRF